MHAAAPGGLRVADQAEFVEQRLEHVHGDGAGLLEPGAWLRVEVDAQFVGMLGVGAAHLPRMQCDRAHLGGPDDRRQVGDLQRIGGAAGRERDLAGFQVVGMLLRHRFW